MEKQFFQRVFMFIASLVIVTNIFCSTHQAYLLSHSKSSVEETILDSKIGTYSAITTSESFFDIEESRVELEEENISDDLNSHSYFSNFEISGALLFYFTAGKRTVPFGFIKQKFPPLFLLLENFRI